MFHLQNSYFVVIQAVRSVWWSKKYDMSLLNEYKYLTFVLKQCKYKLT